MHEIFLATGVGSRQPETRPRKVIPVEKRTVDDMETVPSRDLEKPAFRRRDGFWPRWKSNPSLNRVEEKAEEPARTKSGGKDDLDRPTFLRAHAD